MLQESQTIRLHSSSDAASIAVENVYFAFGSRRLSYDCVACNAKCCRGYGYLATIGPELDRQIAMRPTLPLFVQPNEPRANQFLIDNLTPGCFFLTENGRCEIHAQFGHQAKPETCRLFPFNNLRRLGDFLIVRPHPSLCPLDVAPVRSTSDASDYQSLIREMTAQGITTNVPSCVPVISDAKRLIANERRIVALSEEYLDGERYLEFLEAQALVYDAGSETKSASAFLGEALSVICELLSLPPSAATDPAPGLTRTLVAVTPFVRAQLAFQDLTDKGPVVGPILDIKQFPHALLSLYLLANAASRAGMKRVTFQTVSKLLSDFAPLITLLARTDCVLVWKRAAPIEFNGFATSELRMRFLRLATALLPQRQDRRQATLGDLLKESAPRDEVERTLFLKQTAKLVSRRLVPFGQHRAPGFGMRTLPTFRSAIHRWALHNLNEELLEAAYLRIYAPRGSRQGDHGKSAI